MGLTIVRQLAELHGGSVEASSPGPGLGARFVVRLPVPALAPSGLFTRQRSSRHRGGIFGCFEPTRPQGQHFQANGASPPGRVAVQVAFGSSRRRHSSPNPFEVQAAFPGSCVVAPALQAKTRMWSAAIVGLVLGLALPARLLADCSTRTMRVTFYTCAEGSAHCLTKKGHQPIPFRTIAVGDRTLLGQWLYVEDLGGWVLASDTGTRLKRDSMDVFIGDTRMVPHARRLGVQHWRVRMCPAPTTISSESPPRGETSPETEDTAPRR